MPLQLWVALQNKHLTTLNQVVIIPLTRNQQWFTSHDIGLQNIEHTQWQDFTDQLIHAGTKLRREEDNLIWGTNPTLSSYSVKLVYVIQHHPPHPGKGLASGPHATYSRIKGHSVDKCPSILQPN